MSAIPINGMTLNKELRDKQMTGVGQEGDPMFAVRSNGAQHAVAFNCDAQAEELPTPSRDTSISNGLTCGQRAAAHQGGGLNGQDAYTGRIFACARQPADGADGQGHQHDTGRGADGDCLRKGAN